MTEFKVGDRVRPQWTVMHTGSITYLTGDAASVQWDSTGNTNSWLLKNLIKIEEEPMFKAGDKVSHMGGYEYTIYNAFLGPEGSQMAVLKTKNGALSLVTDLREYRLVEEPKYLFQAGDKVQLKQNLGLVGQILGIFHTQSTEYAAVQWTTDSRPVIERADDLKLI